MMPFHMFSNRISLIWKHQ